MARLAQLGGAGLFVLLVFLSHASSLPARAAAKPDTADVADLVRRAVENYQHREAQREKYTYLARVVRTEFDRNGKAKGRITGTYEIMFLKGAPYRRLILINDLPLSPEQETLEQQLLEAEAKMREAGEGNPQPVHTSFSAPVDQLTKGFRLRRRGKQVLNGREVQVVEAVPDGQPLAASPEQEYARHFRMKVWIDVAEAQIVRVESTVVGKGAAIDQDWIGFSRDRSSPEVEFSTEKHRVEVAPGTVSDTEWIKVNDEVWLPARSYWKTRKMTVMGISSTQRPLSFPVEVTSSYSEYKKFRVDTRIVPK